MVVQQAARQIKTEMREHELARERRLAAEREEAERERLEEERDEAERAAARRRQLEAEREDDVEIVDLREQAEHMARAEALYAPKEAAGVEPTELTNWGQSRLDLSQIGTNIDRVIGESQAARRASERDAESTAGTVTSHVQSVATSKVTLNEAIHTTCQGFRRDIEKRQLQAAVKHGEAVVWHDGTTRIMHEGTTLVTDPSSGKTKIITAWDLDSSARDANKYVPPARRRGEGSSNH